jgi:hypothetical protein
VVITVPEQIAQIAFYNKETVYNILFHAAAKKLSGGDEGVDALGGQLSLVQQMHLVLPDGRVLNRFGGLDRGPYCRPRSDSDWNEW